MLKFLELMKQDGGFIGPQGPQGPIGPTPELPDTKVFIENKEGEMIPIDVLVIGKDFVIPYSSLPKGLTAAEIQVMISDAEARLVQMIQDAKVTSLQIINEMTPEEAGLLAEKLPDAYLQPAYEDEDGSLVNYTFSKPIRITLGKTSQLPPNKVRVTSPKGGVTKTQGPIGGLIDLDFTGGREQEE